MLEPIIRTRQDLAIEEIAKAIYIVNKHAKVATDPRVLYKLKQNAINVLLKEGKARKLGLHFSPTAKNVQQRSDVLVQIGSFLFHMPPTKEDFQELPHLGHRDNSFRNPKVYMGLSKAKNILRAFHPPEPVKVIEPQWPVQPKQSKAKRKRRVSNKRRGISSYFSTNKN